MPLAVIVTSCGPQASSQKTANTTTVEANSATDAKITTGAGLNTISEDTPDNQSDDNDGVVTRRHGSVEVNDLLGRSIDCPGRNPVTFLDWMHYSNMMLKPVMVQTFEVYPGVIDGKNFIMVRQNTHLASGKPMPIPESIEYVYRYDWPEIRLVDVNPETNIDDPFSTFQERGMQTCNVAASINSARSAVAAPPAAPPPPPTALTAAVSTGWPANVPDSADVRAAILHAVDADEESFLDASSPTGVVEVRPGRLATDGDHSCHYFTMVKSDQTETTSSICRIGSSPWATSAGG